jgi:hypothetical protein
VGRNPNDTLEVADIASSMTLAVGKPGFRVDTVSVWEDCLSELADYRKIHGHRNVPQRYSENSKLGNWVVTQKKGK